MPVLLGHYLKTALRGIRRRKGFSFINIAGLAAGMTCAILIFLWVNDELSFDRFHENADRIHRIVAEQRGAGDWSDRCSCRPPWAGR